MDLAHSDDPQGFHRMGVPQHEGPSSLCAPCSPCSFFYMLWDELGSNGVGSHEIGCPRGCNWVIESSRLEKSSKIIMPIHEPITTVPTNGWCNAGQHQDLCGTGTQWCHGDGRTRGGGESGRHPRAEQLTEKLF